MSKRIFFHADLDAFYATVEMLDNPAYRDKTVIVGGPSNSRAVVSACSYAARAFGVRSAMPIVQARKLCPQGIFLPVRIARYSEVSRSVMELLASYTPDLRPLSIDEASLEMTGTEKLWGPPDQAAHLIQDTVEKKLGLSISLGIASNPYLAKIASGIKKPHGLFFVAPGEEENFITSLPLDRIWGAGAKTQEKLHRLGIHTTAALKELSLEILTSNFGKGGGEFLYRAVRGVDPGFMSEVTQSHSLSTERTFAVDISDRDYLHALLLELSDELFYRLRASHGQNAQSKTIHLKIKYYDFSSITRNHTSQLYYQSANNFYQDIKPLFDAAWDEQKAIRLLGVGFHNLETEATSTQGELFNEQEEKNKKLEASIFALKKEGLAPLMRASKLKNKK